MSNTKKKQYKVPYSRRGLNRERLEYDISDITEGEAGEIIPRLLKPKKYNPNLEKKFDYEHASLIVSRTNYTFGYEHKKERETSCQEKFKDPSSLVSYNGSNFVVKIATPLKVQAFYHTVYIEDFQSPEEAYQVALKMGRYMIRCLRFFFQWNSPFTISDFVVIKIKNKIARFYWAQVYRSKTCNH